MASGALFGNSAGGPAASKNLVEFKAGKMYLKANNMVHPDKRKGQVYIYQSDDSLMHFCWKDRSKGSVEDDLIIFPDDCEFKRIAQCTTGRVYLLKFKSSNRKFFFWMQEPKTEKDEELCTKVNDTLNNPPTPGSSRGGSSASGLGLPPEVVSGLGEGDLQSLLGNMSQQQLMQLLGGMGMGGLGGLQNVIGRPSSSQSESSSASRQASSTSAHTTSATPTSTTIATTPATSTTATSGASKTEASSASTVTATATTTASAVGTPASSGTTVTTAQSGSTATNATASSAIQLSDLQNILSGMGAVSAQSSSSVDLGKAISPEAMIPILANEDIQKQLLQFLPEGEQLPRTESELRETVQSPQFQQAMSSFSAALASGQLGPLMGQFGLGEDVANAAAQGDVEAFVKAMQDAMEKKKDE